MADSSTGRDWTAAPDAFADALDDLKTSGCMLLVVESSGGEASHAGCDRMLGAAEYEDRRRLFVQTDAAASSRLAAAGRDPNTEEQVVRYDTTARGAVTADEGTAPDSPAATATDLSELADDAEAAVDDLAPGAGFESGQLRVCVDAVGDMFADTDTAAVVNFVDRLGDIVTDHDGMGHVHVGQHVPSIAAEALLPQFDAVVELADDDAPRHRWHLPDESMSTKWLTLER